MSSKISINKNQFIYSLVFIVMIWGFFWLNFRNIFSTKELGIFPREKFGLYGILLSPFIHGNLEHLISNTISLLSLLFLLAYFFPKHVLKIIVLSIILSGVGTWLIGRSSFHVGASGVIYALISFLIFKGLLTKHYKLLALSFIVIFLHGGSIWYMFPGVEDHISWEGHFSGFISGIILALIVETPLEYKEIKYNWEAPDFNPDLDPFMKHFDKSGNFKNKPTQHSTYHQEKNIVYHYVKNPEDNE